MTTKHLIAAVFVALGALSCSKKPLPDLKPNFVRDVPTDSVESVIFWIGDAGNAEWGKFPILHKLSGDIDQWARTLDRDSSVAVVFLGDNVYPGGVHDPGTIDFPGDSIHLEAQVDVMRSPGARSSKSFAVFLPGNHDWGHKFGAEGERRLKNQSDFLARRRAQGIRVALLPASGTPGPAVIDVGRHTRILIIDTAWWLLAPNLPEKNQLMDRVLAAMSTAGERNVAIATHHPYKSASAHGGVQPIWAGLGIKWLLTKSGAALQDLNSLPYRDFLDRLEVIFERTGPPLLFAGGHDHVLQVIKGTQKLDPRFMIVSGAGSKSSQVGHIDGMVYRGNQPGYMRMIVKKNGGVDLYVVSAPEEFMTCNRGLEDLNQQCIAAGVQAFKTTYSMTLR
ncbi:MAG TPA: hypothetical protein VGD49_06300 [Longimicrobiales bacterium]